MNEYVLLDFGDGRRLERFGDRIVDRPCPAAEGLQKRDPSAWREVDFRFVSDRSSRKPERGTWKPDTPESWPVSFDLEELGTLKMELHGTPFGHLGVFPEQQSNWRRIARLLRSESRRRPLRVLNLFAYTGGSSIAAALAGIRPEDEDPRVEVVHVDSSKSVADWARRNARLNGIGQGIRFIVEDVRKFVRRELKRGNRYDAVILDPPSYGHGAKGEVWKIDEHLPELVGDLSKLLDESPLFFLATAHSPGWGPSEMERLLRRVNPCPGQRERFFMEIVSRSGNSLPAGAGIFSWR